MEHLSLLAFVLAALVVLLIPGPGVIYVVTRSLTQGRKAGLDPKKNKAVLYVALTHNVVVIFEAHKMSNAVEAVKYFASKTDLDCLKEKFKKYKKEYRKNVL